MSRIADLLRALPTHPGLPPALAVLAMLLCAPCLGNGLFLDDYIHQAILLQPEELPEMHGSVDQLFAFIGSEHSLGNVGSMSGFLPWWTSEDLRLAFWRPLAGASHWLDHRLWPESPMLMHLQSLLWLGATVWLGTIFFRRFFGAEAAVAAALAAFFFAVDDVHAWPAMWVANRNALISATFGLLCLIAHDRWRRQGWIAGAFWAPACLLLAVGAGESAVACGAYLLGYALFLDPAPWRQRLRSLLPTASVGVLWLLVYKLRGFGAHGSSGYLDPLGEPLRFLIGFFERAPILVMALWSPLSADLYLLGSKQGQASYWWLAVGFSAVMFALLAPVVRRDPRARFCAFAMVASLVPASIIFPMNRQLLYASIGAVGLLALLVTSAFRPLGERPATAWHWPARCVAVLMLLAHAALAPLALLSTAPTFDQLARVMERAIFSLPSEPEIVDQRAIVVNVPGHVFTSGAEIVRVLEGRPNPRQLLVLAAGIGETEVERIDARTLAVRPEGGYMPALGEAPGEDGSRFDLMRVFTSFDTLFFDAGKMPTLGARFDRPGVEIEITGVTESGRPAEATFRFDQPLEHGELRWLAWRGGVFEPFVLPRVGETRILERPTLFPRRPASQGRASAAPSPTRSGTIEADQRP